MDALTLSNLPGRWIRCPRFTVEETDLGLLGFAQGLWASERWQQDPNLALSALRQGIGKYWAPPLESAERWGPQQAAHILRN